MSLQTISYKERRAKGLCGTCGERPPSNECALCQVCLDKNAQRARLLRVRVLQAYGARCTDCGDVPSEDQLVFRWRRNYEVPAGQRITTAWVWSQRCPDYLELWCTGCRQLASETNKANYIVKHATRLQQRQREYCARHKVRIQQVQRARRLRLQKPEWRAQEIARLNLRFQRRMLVKDRRTMQEQQALDRSEHPTEYRAQQNRARCAAARKRYAAKPEQYRQRIQARRDGNREMFRTYRRKGRSTLRGQLDIRCRRLLKRVLDKAGLPKTSRTRMLLGYSPAEFKAAIEAQFRAGMTWDNVGQVWEIDHVREVATFLDEGVTDPAVINALANLQPLLVAEHKAKTAAFLTKRALDS